MRERRGGERGAVKNGSPEEPPPPLLLPLRRNRLSFGKFLHLGGSNLSKQKLLLSNERIDTILNYSTAELQGAGV